MTSEFANEVSLPNYFWFKFHVNIITSSGAMTVFYLKGIDLNRKSEIPPSEFCPISGDWGKLGIPNLARMSLIKCYRILQNTRVTAFTVSELLKENQHRGKITPPRVGLNNFYLQVILKGFAKLWVSSHKHLSNIRYLNVSYKSLKLLLNTKWSSFPTEKINVDSWVRVC